MELQKQSTNTFTKYQSGDQFISGDVQENLKLDKKAKTVPRIGKCEKRECLKYYIIRMPSICTSIGIFGEGLVNYIDLMLN